MSINEKIRKCNKLYDIVKYTQYKAEQACDKITVTNWHGTKNKNHACIIHDNCTERDGVVDEHTITVPSISYTKTFCPKFIDCPDKECQYFKDYQEYCIAQNNVKIAKKNFTNIPLGLRTLAWFKREKETSVAWKGFIDVIKYLGAFFGIGLLYGLFLYWLETKNNEITSQETNEKIKNQDTSQTCISFYQALQLFNQAKQNTKNK